MKVCVCDGCETPFAPRGNRKTCSDECSRERKLEREREYNRERYQRDFKSARHEVH